MTSGPLNPWAARFEPLLDKDEIARRAEVVVSPIIGLNSLPVEQAVKLLTATFEFMYVPTSQGIDILHRWAGIAHAHCLVRYKDRKDFLAGIYAKEPPLIKFSFASCLAGLGGTGKTELVKAFQRIQLADSQLVVDENHGPFPLHSVWKITINAKSSTKDLLKYLAGVDGTIRDLLEKCQKLAYLNGVAIVFADEFQYATQSSLANTRVTQMLYLLAYLGLPFIYVTNYSLLARLLKRPQEDRHRLLNSPMVLLPDQPDSTDWIKLLHAQKMVAPDVLEFDVMTDGAAIHHYSAGIKRAEKSLIAIAYRISRETGKGKVTLREIEKAFKHTEYTIFRRDVEDLLTQQIQNKKVRGREDLWCPIDIPRSIQAAFTEKTTEERNRRVAEEKLKSAMTADERKAYNEQEKANGKIKEPSKVVKMKRKGPVSAEELKNNAEWFNDQL